MAALKHSSNGIEALLKVGLESGGQIPPSRGYVWRNLSLDVGHVLTYFVAHEVTGPPGTAQFLEQLVTGA